MNSKKEAIKLSDQNNVGVITFFSFSDDSHCTINRDEKSIWAQKPMAYTNQLVIIGFNYSVINVLAFHPQIRKTITKGA